MKEFIYENWYIILISTFLPFFISYLGTIFLIKKKLFIQPIRVYGPENHLRDKRNIPGVGAISLLFGIFVTHLILYLFFDIFNEYIFIILTTFFAFGLVGLMDDLMKVLKNNSKGLRGSIKLVIQLIISSVIAVYIVNSFGSSYVYFPFIDKVFDFKEYYLVFSILMIVGSSNAANLTDGLDGLLTLPLILILTSFIIISSVVSLDLEDKISIIISCLIVIFSLLAFLKFNYKPAKIFMGDTGSLSFGAVVAVIAIILKQEIVFAFLSFLFILEALSVIIQVTGYKMFRKRVFFMTPLHHHFEKKGIGEDKITKSFWMISLISSTIGVLGFFLSV